MPTPHRATVTASPWPGVHATQIESGRHFARHWHAIYGLGLVDAGAQSSASGRGPVEAYAGDLLATNPGEVHDGQPLGGPTRRWRMIYLEPQVLHAMAGDLATASPQGLALARPVIQHDTALRDALHQLLQRLAHGGTAPQRSAGRAARLARKPWCAPVPCCCAAMPLRGACMHPTPTFRPRCAACATAWRIRRRHRRRQPLAAMVGLGKYQLLRRFSQAYGLPPMPGCGSSAPSVPAAWCCAAPGWPMPQPIAALPTRAT